MSFYFFKVGDNVLLNRVKTLLSVTDNDELIYEIIEITKSKILNYINKEELPKELEFILVEMAVSRFNKIGSEGFSSESTDGKSISYEDDFEIYKQYLDDYLFKTGQNKGFKLL